MGFIAHVHVASPRGQARAPTWRRGDAGHWCDVAHTLYLQYIFNYITYRSSDYRKTRLLNALIRQSIYSEYLG